MSIVTEILNPFIKTRNQVKNKSGQWVDQPSDKWTQHSASLRGNISKEGGSVNIINRFNREIVIDSFSFLVYENIHATCHKDSREVPYVTQIFHSLTTAGPSASFPYIIDRDGHDYLEIQKKDENSEGKTYYIVRLKKPLYLPEGCHLELKAGNSVTGSFMYKVFWRERPIYE